MEKLSQIDQIRAYISYHGVTKVAKKTKISVRTLHYLIKGEFKPNYDTLQKLLKEMGQ